MKPICTNPYLNTVAQVVEIVHSVEESIKICDELIARGIKKEEPYKFSRQGWHGVGSCEVPRGILFHNYEIGDDGNIVNANCIIPTGQNLANIEADMRALVPQILRPGPAKGDVGARDARARVRSVYFVLGAFPGCQIRLVQQLTVGRLTTCATALCHSDD